MSTTVFSTKVRPFLPLTDGDELSSGVDELSSGVDEYQPGKLTRLHNAIGELWHGLKEAHLRSIQFFTSDNSDFSQKVGLGSMIATNSLDGILKDNINDKLNAKGRACRHIAGSQQFGVFKRIWNLAKAAFFYGLSGLGYIGRGIAVFIVGFVSLALNILLNLAHRICIFAKAFAKAVYEKIAKKPKDYDPVSQGLESPRSEEDERWEIV